MEIEKWFKTNYWPLLFTAAVLLLGTLGAMQYAVKENAYATCALWCENKGEIASTDNLGACYCTKNQTGFNWDWAANHHNESSGFSKNLTGIFNANPTPSGG